MKAASAKQNDGYYIHVSKWGHERTDANQRNQNVLESEHVQFRIVRRFETELDQIQNVDRTHGKESPERHVI